MMTLIWNWKAVLKRAWSIRLIVVAAVLSGLEVALPLLDLPFVEPRWFALGSFTRLP
jgi:hydrogenase/urease accessory protein HupE